jgi:hypothetical protein
MSSTTESSGKEVQVGSSSSHEDVEYDEAMRSLGPVDAQMLVDEELEEDRDEVEPVSSPLGVPFDSSQCVRDPRRNEKRSAKVEARKRLKKLQEANPKKGLKEKVSARHWTSAELEEAKQKYFAMQNARPSTRIPRGTGIRVAGGRIVPKSTLHRHIHQEHVETVGRPLMFTPQEETMMVEHISYAERKDITLSKEYFFIFVRYYIRRRRQRWVEEGNIPSLQREDKKKMPDDLPGDKWFYNFLKRHPEVKHAFLKVKPTSKKKVDLTLETFQTFFENFFEVAHSIPKENLQNRDETGMKLQSSTEKKIELKKPKPVMKLVLERLAPEKLQSKKKERSKSPDHPTVKEPAIKPADWDLAEPIESGEADVTMEEMVEETVHEVKDKKDDKDDGLEEGEIINDDDEEEKKSEAENIMLQRLFPSSQKPEVLPPPNSTYDEDAHHFNLPTEANRKPEKVLPLRTVEWYYYHYGGKVAEMRERERLAK